MSIDTIKGREYAFPVEIVDHVELAPERDPFFDPIEHERIMREMHEAVLTNRNYAATHPSDPQGENPGLDALKAEYPHLNPWLEMVAASTSLALDPLYDPGSGQLREGIPLDENLAHWFKNLPIGLALRNRRQLDTKLTEEGLLSGSGYPSVLSIPSGNGLAAVTAAVTAKEAGKYPFATLVDIDEASVERAHHTAQEAGLAPEEFELIARNAMNPKGFQSGMGMLALLSVIKFNQDHGNGLHFPTGATKRIESNTYDVTSSIGSLEYLLAEDWDFGSVKMAGVETMIKNLHRVTKPGGRLVIGSMNLVSPDHPEVGTQPMVEFLQEVIRWRGLRPSTEFGDNGIQGEIGILPIIESSGIHPSRVTVHREPNGIYNVYEIRKQL